MSINPTTGVTSVHLIHLYELSSEGKVKAVKSTGIKEILSDNGMDKVEYKLLDMTWQMLARAIAKDAYVKDIDAAKADTLAKILQGDNGGSDRPAKVLSGLDPLTGGEKLISLLKYWHSNQYYVYQGFMNSTQSWFAWGRFPDKLPVNVTKAFEAALMEEPVKPAPVVKRAPKVKLERDTQEAARPAEPAKTCARINPMTGNCLKWKE